MQMSPLIAVHMSAAIGAVVLGPVALWARRGRILRPRLHRAFGHAWVTLMLATAISAIFIRDYGLPDIAGYTPIHLLVPVTLVSLFGAFRHLVRGNIEGHRKTMQSVYLGACIVAGGFVLRFAGSTRQDLFGRYLLLAPYLHHRAPANRPGNGACTPTGSRPCSTTGRVHERTTMQHADDKAPPGAAMPVLEYWLGDALQQGWPSQSRSDLWFGGGQAQDDAITQRFGTLVEQALDDGLADWENTPLGRLALVIVLDQFTRNMFRGQGRAFSGDGRAQALACDALRRGWDLELPGAGAVFLYMPLMHAENLALQEQCVSCFESLLARSPAERQKDLQGNLAFARQHRDIIAQFGRFPYRNAALGRTSSTQEADFLREGPRFGQ